MKSGRQFSKSEEHFASCGEETRNALLDTRESFTEYCATKGNVCSSSFAFRDFLIPCQLEGLVNIQCLHLYYTLRKEATEVGKLQIRMKGYIEEVFPEA